MSYAADAYEPAPEGDELARWLAWGFVVAFGLFAAWGWLSAGVNALTLMLGFVFGLFQIATNLLAVKVRELAGRGAWLTCLGALGAMVGSGLLTHESLVHAYGVALEEGYVSADPKLMNWLLLFVPYLEPLMFWINKLLTEPRKVKSERKVKAHQGIFVALWVMLFGPGVANAAPATVVSPRAIESQVQGQSRNVVRPRFKNDAQRAKALRLIQAGEKAGRVHAETGVPLSTCKLWARQERAAA